MTNGQRAANRDSGWIDYLLSAVLGTLALFCGGQGVGQPIAGLILMGIYIAGTGASFVLSRKTKGTRFETWDAPLYGIAALITIFGQDFLNQLLPPDTFPPELRSAAYISWLLSLGSFCGWRDATRLFQAVPALAMFGLVGVYDTYAPATVIFFGFLLCLALMFGRAHARAMLVQARRSGFSRVDEGVSLSEAAMEQDSMLRAMRRGPWRWMAGPEWAVGSAGAVILISLLGAPIIHESVQGVAGLVRINVPARLRQAQTSSAVPLTASSLSRVGQGPRRLNPSVLGAAKMDKSRYLRTEVYDHYNSGGWSVSLSAPSDDIAQARTAELNRLDAPRKYSFEITMNDPGAVGWLPVPAEVVSVSEPSDARIEPDGRVFASSSNLVGIAEDSSVEFGASAPAKYLQADPTNESAASGQVIELARNSTVNCHNDYEKAMALMDAIDAHAKYNLRAAAVPRTEDPVDYFLFTSHEGYCDLFASAMVEMARAVGMKSRYVTGYLTSEQDLDEYHRYVIRQSGAHAWAEIYFHGVGWMVFDATTGAEDITPKDDGLGGHMSWSWLLPLLGLAALAAAVYYLPRLRFNRKLPAKAVKQRKLDVLYAQFARELGKRAKLRKSPAESPDAWLARTLPSLGAAAEDARRLNAMFVTALYAAPELSESRLQELRAALQKFKRSRS